jgi:hypothetical protein
MVRTCYVMLGGVREGDARLGHNRTDKGRIVQVRLCYFRLCQVKRGYAMLSEVRTC